MPKKNIVRKSEVTKLSDNETIQCCIDGQTCPLQVSNLLKKRLFKNENNFYLENFLTEQSIQLKAVLNQCINVGESNSVLVIGPRGSGKSKLVEKTLAELHNENVESFYYVYLSGIIHTDDKLSLQDMTRQLQLENVTKDKVFGSFSDNLAFVLEALKNGTAKSKSIVIVLDEFDCFASHKNQTLLYNLFDITMSQQNPMCVIGITCRLDVVELLEKRVKSRYSHRSILTFPTYDFSTYTDYFKQLLALPDYFDCPIFKYRWNTHVKDLFNSSNFNDILKKQFHITKHIGGIIQLLTIPICNLSYAHPFVTVDDINSSYNSLHADSKSFLMQGLAILELCLIVAAKHVLEKRIGQPFNFEMVYNEYENFSKSCLTGVHISKAVAMKAYEHLLTLELIRSTENQTGNSLAKEFKPMLLYVDASQIRETLANYTDCPTELKNWGDSMFVS
ncbi:origin recognition complex subunit 4 isoform X1 [Hydra vulgaris]|uniref:origin recognition complex subunit 4 isoform X1 n=1 Tax=Hydra vulgaris TaxID=6087 RepID=UPI0006416DB0|nr:origin recognition complex subunit 4 [Hydra vulgaris]